MEENCSVYSMLFADFRNNSLNVLFSVQLEIRGNKCKTKPIVYLLKDRARILLIDRSSIFSYQSVHFKMCISTNIIYKTKCNTLLDC